MLKINSNYDKKKIITSTVVHVYHLTIEKQKLEGPWGSLASQASQPNEIGVNERLCLQNRKKVREIEKD